MDRVHDLVVDGVHLGSDDLVDTMMTRLVDPERERLLERPRRHVPREPLVSRRTTVRQGLACVLVAEQGHATGEHDARILERLKAGDETESTACPETLSSSLRSVHEVVCAGIIQRVCREAFWCRR